MRNIQSRLARAAVAVLALGVMVDTASAACTKLGFSVNDYGKDGPTKDAKELLDKYIAKWAAEKGIAKYTTGKKDVTCELFLNFIVFDEHTCRAEATVCWDGPAVKPGATPAAAEGAAPAEKKEKATTAAAKPAKSEKIETGSTEAPASHPVKEQAAAKAPETSGEAPAAPKAEAKPEAPAPAAAQ